VEIAVLFSLLSDTISLQDALVAMTFGVLVGKNEWKGSPLKSIVVTLYR
jgi:hypothetical protein